jgi:L-fucose mutarotase/ribose pyranase (RbsD/FucU family)
MEICTLVALVEDTLELVVDMAVVDNLVDDMDLRYIAPMVIGNSSMVVELDNLVVEVVLGNLLAVVELGNYLERNYFDNLVELDMFVEEVDNSFAEPVAACS